MQRYTHTVEYYSAVKRNEITPFATTWMDLEIIILSEVSQRKTNTIYHLYVESKKWYKWAELQNRNTVIQNSIPPVTKQNTNIENQFIITKGGKKGDKVGVGISRCTLLYIKQINNKDLMYSIGNYIQYLIIIYNGKNLEKECVYTHTHTHTHTYIFPSYI